MTFLPLADYRYNALGQQVSRTMHFGGGAAAVTLSVHDLAGNRLSEHDSSGAVLREYIWLDGRPLAVIEGGQTYWLSWDQIGRPVMATDAAGTVVWAASYLPFGGIRAVSIDTGALTQDLRFPGQWFQAETGLHQNWHRDFDPTTGRYLQADPLGLVDGPSVYGYARQNPVRWTDPTGEQSALMQSLPVAGGLAAADGPAPIGDILAALLVGGAIVYDLCTSDDNIIDVCELTAHSTSTTAGEIPSTKCIYECRDGATIERESLGRRQCPGIIKDPRQ